ncbi:toll/interleukin-1 receptor domain-containing protein [Acinetobacter baumannii]|uniref:toll/interleukin-1 receptor domain-containing protein n=1 Tax=Acinetobacter baumannii TaxID=470 RepID=UPI003891C287|nr:toll/interleukin-1 receptor domain-containing protein [Acinetobacter baumannii]
MSNKPIVFVSHAAVDSEIATLFKSDVEKSFLGLCQLFVSSNLDSIQGGKEWMQEIKTNLSEAAVLISLISPVSITRPWIYAEFGAGWIRGIPTISVCHSGLRKDQLPVPLSHFQALDLLDEMHLEHLYGQISLAIGCHKPEKDYSKLTEKYREITETNRKKRSIKQWHANIQQWNPEFTKVFRGESVEILIPAEFDFAFREFKNEIELQKILVLEPKGMSMGTRVGMQATNWLVSQGENFKDFQKIVTE